MIKLSNSGAYLVHGTEVIEAGNEELVKSKLGNKFLTKEEASKNTIAYGVDNLAQFAEENASSGQITKENMNNLEQVMEQCKGSTDKIANVSAELVTQIKKFSGNGLKKR